MSFLGTPRFREFRNRVLCGATEVAVRGLLTTLRYRDDGWDALRRRREKGEGAILAIWHDVLMVPLGHACRKGAVAMISPGRDGEFAARVVGGLGVGSIRGSSSRDAVKALRASLRELGGPCILVITPDGPRGPRYRFQAGAAWVASRTGLPVFPLGVGVTRAWRLRTWDRYHIPKPFSRCHLVFGSPVVVPKGLGRADLETHRRRLEEALGAASRVAAAAAGRTWPEEP